MSLVLPALMPQGMSAVRYLPARGLRGALLPPLRDSRAALGPSVKIPPRADALVCEHDDSLRK